MAILKLLPSVVVVFNVAMGDLETEAAVVGNLTSPTQGVPGEVVTLIQGEVATPTQGEVATPIQGTRVLLMFPPVGMEALIVVALDRVLARFGAGTAIYHFHPGSDTLPTARRLLAKVIVMRAKGTLQ